MKRAAFDPIPHERAVWGCVALDPTNALPVIDKAEPMPPPTDPDAAAVARYVAAEQNAGRPVTAEGIMAGCGLDAAAWQRLADSGCMPHEVGAHVRAIHEGEALRRAVEILTRPDADAGYKLQEVTNLLEPLAAGGAGDAVATVDVVDWLAVSPPPHNPVLADLFDTGSLVEVVGPSKTRKSFALMQLAFGLATGRGAFGFTAGSSFRVLLADMELTPADIQRRAYRMARALGIKDVDIGGRLHVLPLAGHADPQTAIERAGRYDVLIADPLYCLCDGGETIEDLRPVLRWLRALAAKCAAVVYCHHDGKGFAGERNTRDRGSGSGITGRAVNARITLTPSAADPDNALVMGFLCRSYATPAASVWRFNGDCFEAYALQPDTETDAG